MHGKELGHFQSSKTEKEFLLVSCWDFKAVQNHLAFLINPLQDDKILDWSKLKSCADDKIKVTENLKFVL